MIDFNPELLTLKSILFQHRSFHEAFFRLKINERVSSLRIERAKARASFILRHKESLSFECRNLFPCYDISQDEFLLSLIALSVLRNEKAGEDDVRNAYCATFQSMRMLGDMKKNVAVLLEAAKKPFIIPDELKKSPCFYNSLVLEMPEFFLAELYKDYSLTEALSICRKLRSKTSFYYKSIDNKEVSDTRLNKVALTDGSFLYLSKDPIPTTEMKGEGLYSVHFVENEAMSHLGVSPLSSNVLIVGTKDVTSYLPFAYKIKECYQKQLIPVEEDSVKYRYAVNLSFQHHFDYVKPLCSSMDLLKTYLSYDSFETVVYFAKDSRVGLARRKPEILPSLEKRTFLTSVSKEKKELEESAMFVKKSGCLLFVSSSFFKKETEEVVSDFLSKRKDFSLEEERMVLGDASESDLGYYAILRRTKE